MQIANVIHAISAVLWIALILGHIYLGTVGVPGTLQAMTQGEVTAEWAQEHHNLWYEELRRQGIAPEEMPAGEPGRRQPRVPGT
jgi:formate dehydrogenase subunit gamma